VNVWWESSGVNLQAAAGRVGFSKKMQPAAKEEEKLRGVRRKEDILKKETEATR
jgi:hypothetical protein